MLVIQNVVLSLFSQTLIQNGNQRMRIRIRNTEIEHTNTKQVRVTLINSKF